MLSPTWPPRVLVIDDEKEVRDVIADVLEIDGLDVQTPSDGREALALMNRNPFDLIFCDLRMPQMKDGQAATFVTRDAPLRRRPTGGATGKARRVARKARSGPGRVLAR